MRACVFVLSCCDDTEKEMEAFVLPPPPPPPQFFQHVVVRNTSGRKRKAAAAVSAKKTKKRVRARDDDAEEEDNYDDDEEEAEEASGFDEEEADGEAVKLPAPNDKLEGVAHQVADLNAEAVMRSMQELGMRRTELRPLSDFPAEFQTNRENYADCELCTNGDSGRTAHSNQALKAIYGLLNEFIGTCPMNKIYEMQLTSYNDYVRSLNASSSLFKLGQEAYKEWTFEMVRNHFEHHEVSVPKMLHDAIVTLSDKMRFTHRNMTYYEQERGGEKVVRSDKNSEDLFLRQISTMLKLVEALEKQRVGGKKTAAGGGGAAAGKSTAMSRLTQASASRGETGFNNR